MGNTKQLIILLHEDKIIKENVEVLFDEQLDDIINEISYRQEKAAEKAEGVYQESKNGLKERDSEFYKYLVGDELLKIYINSTSGDQQAIYRRYNNSKS